MRLLRSVLICYFSICMAFFDMRTSSCLHFGAKLACRRPGTKYCVDLFFFRTLWLPPEVIFTSVSSDPTFHHGLCFFASVATFLFATTPPTSVSIARLRAVRCRGRWRLRPRRHPIISPSLAVAAAAAEDALLSRRRWQWAAAAVGCSAWRWRRSCAIKLSSGRTVIQRWRCR